ncbi:MAG: bifunctional aldolase/short-chain dehydrogenase [Chitinispirillaceae bacterium]|nr:bifunctional aldolase/short-chain dehydrogenase [Chitinispirillaceae bacterium]
MHSLWDESEITEFKLSFPSNLPPTLIEQIYATRLLGTDKKLVLHGGGNTSCKVKYKNILGEVIDTLFIKASGCNMAEVEAKDFIPLELNRLLKLENIKEISDEEMIEYFVMSRTLPSKSLPSIETLLHAFLPFTFVDHTHPTAILAITNRKDCEILIKEVLGATVELIPYVKVGIECALAVKNAFQKNTSCKAIIIKQHGLVTWGESAKEAYTSTIDIVDRVEKFLEKKINKSIQVNYSNEKSEKAKSLYVKIAPIIRAELSQVNPLNEEIKKSPILYLLSNPEILALLEKKDFIPYLISTPITPDYIIRIGREPLFIESVNFEELTTFKDTLCKKIEEYSEKNIKIIGKYLNGKISLSKYLPKVIVIPEIGIICCRDSFEEAKRAAEIMAQEIEVKKNIFESGGEYYNLDEEHCIDMEFRIYQRAKVDKKEEGNVLTNRIVLVTGAAGAIGRGLCSYLLEKGCCVVASDLDKKSVDDFVKELKEKFNTSRIFSLQMDVTDEVSVKKGFQTIVEILGGIDAIVVNAGIAHVSNIENMSLSDFQRLEKVNIEGTLLTIREATKVFKLQNIGGDIVLISTKNVFSPGASFGAYSATKAAAHQLARIASLELAPFNIRVNMVAPDAVFSYGSCKSGLWSAVGPERMRSRGLDEKGLEEYYRNRNLLKAKVEATHVAAAVEFFLKRSTPTTGATIPVDGGLPDATPR